MEVGAELLFPFVARFLRFSAWHGKGLKTKTWKQELVIKDVNPHPQKSAAESADDVDGKLKKRVENSLFQNIRAT